MVRKLTTLTLAVIVMGVLCGAAQARNIVVDPNGFADFTTIQAAIDAAVYGDTIQVSAGIYFENITLANGVKLIGEVIGSEPNNTIIDADNYGSVVTSLDCDPNTVLEGFTLTNGRGTWNMLMVSDGGGVFCRDSGLTIRNCTFSSNVAALGRGGGIYCSGGSPKLINCTFIANYAAKGGGVFCGWESDPELINCTFIANTADYGGGMNCDWDSSPTITGCTFTGNSAEWDGGGFFCSRSNPIITNCIFKANSANHPFLPHPHQNVGGGMCYWNSNPLVTNCIFNGNYADYGGGVFSSRSSLTVTSCTFSGNQAISGNTLASDFSNQRYPGTIELSNCILWDGADQIWNNDSSALTITYSDILGGWGGEGNIDDNPKFVQPGFWDGNVWVDGDYHLLLGSPSINTGDPAYPPAPGETDLDGNPRILEGRIDMGCYEFLPAIPAVVNIIPKTLNTKSQGRWITCNIKAPAGYTVADIDKDSIKLADLVPAQHVQANPGKQQLTMKFDRSIVIDTLILQEGLDRNGGFNIFADVTVTGQLNDGKTFEGTDKIRLLHNTTTKRHKK
ncbi:MAG: hypothetical protein FVQ80_01055 [Planctomycetes bacterium]|nr:hypothetical protein [Planctomycetota bacterium]